MRRPIIATSAYRRELRRYVRKHPREAAQIADVLARLEADAFQPSLKAHKLQGKYAGRWACSGGYDLRIVFVFILTDAESIALLTIGTHDDVY